MQTRPFYDSIWSLFADYQVLPLKKIHHRVDHRVSIVINGFIRQYIVKDDPIFTHIGLIQFISLIDTYLTFTASHTFQFGNPAPNKSEFNEQDIQLHKQFIMEYEQGKIGIGDDVGYVAFNPNKSIVKNTILSENKEKKTIFIHSLCGYGCMSINSPHLVSLGSVSIGNIHKYVCGNINRSNQYQTRSQDNTIILLNTFTLPNNKSNICNSKVNIKFINHCQYCSQRFIKIGLFGIKKSFLRQSLIESYSDCIFDYDDYLLSQLFKYEWNNLNFNNCGDAIGLYFNQLFDKFLQSKCIKMDQLETDFDYLIVDHKFRTLKLISKQRKQEKSDSDQVIDSPNLMRFLSFEFERQETSPCEMKTKKINQIELGLKKKINNQDDQDDQFCFYLTDSMYGLSKEHKLDAGKDGQHFEYVVFAEFRNCRCYGAIPYTGGTQIAGPKTFFQWSITPHFLSELK